MKLSDVLKLYERSAEPSIDRYRVPCSTAQLFAASVTGLIRELAEDAAVEPWAELVGAARAARWRAAVEPLELDHPMSGAKLALNETYALADRLLPLTNGMLELQLQRLLEACLLFHEAGNRELVAAVLESLRDGDPADTSLVVINKRAATAAQRRLAEAGVALAVRTPREFMTGPLHDFCVVVGPGEWFPPQMLTSLRAEQVSLVHYAHLRDADTFHGVFGSSASVRLSVAVRQPRGGATAPGVADEAEAPVQLDWSHVIEQATAVVRNTAVHPEEQVKARLILLAGGHGCWVSLGSSTIRGLDLTAPSGERVVAYPVATLSPGQVVLLRAGGSLGSVLRTLADQELITMGHDAQAVRQRQREWKSALRSQLRRQGSAGVIKTLRLRGARTANVRHWAGDDNLRPLHDADFELLLQLLGLVNTGVHLADGRALWRAHQRAGIRLAEALEDVIEGADLAPLELDGFQELTLPEQHTGARLQAFRVVAVGEEVRDVPLASTRKAFRLGGGLRWLE